MPLEMLSPISFLLGTVISYAASNFFSRREVQTQQDVLKRGLIAEGKVTAITGAAITGRRVYFEFIPNGDGSLVQCCQMDRRDGGEWIASLPSVGTRVAVRYLPENPRRAVIAKLVSRLVSRQ